MSDIKIVEVFKGLIEALKNPEHQRAIVEECRCLAITAIHLDESFERIKILLDGTGPDTLKGRFGGLKQQYVKLLQQSRDGASMTGSRIKEFDQIFLDIVQNATDKSEVEEASGALKQFAKNSMNGMSPEAPEECLKLPADLKAFDDDFTALGLGNATVGADIKGLTDKINEKTLSLKSNNDAILQAASLSLGKGGSVQALVTLVDLAPSDIWSQTTLAPCAFQKMYNMKELALLESDVGTKIDELDNNPAKIKASLDQAVRLSEKIASCLSHVSGAVWKNISADAQSLANDLDRYDSPDFDETTKLRTEFLRVLSRPLRDGLEVYAQSIAG